MGSLPDPECSGVGHLSQVRTRLRLSQPRSWNAPLQGMCSGCLAVQALPVPTSSLQSAKADARIRTADPFITRVDQVSAQDARGRAKSHGSKESGRARWRPKTENDKPVDPA